MTRIDVFYRTAPQTWLRAGVMAATLARWKMEPDINLRVIASSPIEGGDWLHQLQAPEAILLLNNFHWRSRLYADEQAQTDPYLLIDDDHLILGSDWVGRAVRVWQDQAVGYTMLSATSHLVVEQPAWPEGQPRPVVYQAPHCCGAPYLTSPGAVPYSMFSGPPTQQDQVVSDWMRLQGLKFGYMRDLTYNHVGHGFSQTEPAWWCKI